MSARRSVVQSFLVLLCIFTIAGCRSRLGGACKTKSDCALGLYCDTDKNVCDDRGKLLKKQAEELYMYPIPPKQPAQGQPNQALPAPVPQPLP